MKHVSLSVWNYAGKKVCELYDSFSKAKGQAYDINYTVDLADGWQEVEFSLPFMVDDKENYRWNHIKAEMLLRLIEGGFTEWFIIRQPSLSKDSGTTAKVKADHISSVLKTRGIYKVFDDTNGIGTMEYLMTQALDGTGWSLGQFDPIYESDGTSLKVRSITSDGQQGVLEIIGTICSLFKCYPIFHGNTHTVEIRALKHKQPQWEAEIGRNLSAMTVNYDSTNIVTRLYVEGRYTDDGYIGIDDVNPTGMNFLFNFDYYKSIGMFTDDQQTLVDQYLEHLKYDKQQIAAISTSSAELLNRAQQLWGFPTYVIWKVYSQNGSYLISNDSETYVDGSGTVQIGRYVSDTSVFNENQRKLLEGDECYIIGAYNNTYSHRIVTMDSTPSVADLGLRSTDKYVVKFKRDAPTGGWGVKESGYAAQQALIDQANAVLTRQWKTQEEIDDANTTIAEATPKRDAILRGEVYAMGRDTAGGTLTKMLTLRQKQVGTTTANLVLSGRNQAQRVSIQLEKKGVDPSEFSNKYRYTISNGTSGMIVFNDQNEFRVTIPANGYITFQALPIGITFTSTYIKQDGSNWVKVASLSATVDGFGGLHEVMYEAAKTGWDYQAMMHEVVTYQNDMTEQENLLASGLGELLKDGRWNDENYIPGQEQALYEDALDISKEMGYPTVAYDVSLVRIAEGFGVPTDMVQLNSALRVYDPDIPINDIVYVTKITRSLDHQDEGSVEISNSDVTASMVSLESVLGRMKEISDKLEARRTLYDRIAGVISDDGSVYVSRLNGEIDILKNRLLSAKSGWYTDDSGNIMFEDVNGTSAMMLAGQGFMIANGKTEDGDWNWRTFGTGEGFTADAIITGYLSAERIEAGSINFTKFDDATRSQITTLEETVGSLDGRLDADEVTINTHTQQLTPSKLVEALNTTTGNKTYASTLTMTSGSLSLSFETAATYANDGKTFVSNQGTYLTADQTGLSIKKSGSNIHLLITNDTVGFYKGAHTSSNLETNRVAYLNNEKLYVTNGDFTGTLHVGSGKIFFGDNTARTSYYSNALVMEYTSASASDTYTAYGKVAVTDTYSSLEYNGGLSYTNYFRVHSNYISASILGATNFQIKGTPTSQNPTAANIYLYNPTTISAKLTVSAGGLAVNTGGASITGNTTVSGTLKSTSTLTSGGKLTVSDGGATITGATSIAGNTSITGTLSATSTATVNKLVVGKTTAPTGTADILGRVDIRQASENGYSLVVKNFAGYNNLVIGGEDGMVLRGDTDPIKMYGDIYLQNSGTTRVIFHVGTDVETSTVCYRFTESNGLQRSTNGGDTWTTIAG